MVREDDPATTPTVEASAGDTPPPPRASVATAAAAATTPAAASSAGDGLAPGTRLGRYVVRERLGAGGMGEVHAAYDPDLDRPVALKLLHRALGDAHAAERLRREARTMARLSHRNVVAVHDVGEHDGRLFLAMELLAGTTLRGWARGRPWREVLRAFLDAGHGLAAAHAAGVVHRDFKPDNVLRDQDGRVAVTDFGIARRRGQAADGGGPDAPLADVALTRTGAMIGTPLYMAPEQLAGAQADARSDQFAFAVALWEALYGAHPLVPPGADLEALTVAMGGGAALTPPPGPVPTRVGKALARALRPDPAARWPTLPTLLAELDVLRPRTLRVALAVAAAAVAALAAAALVYGTQAGRPQGAAGAVCGGGDAAFAAVWSPARQAALRAEVLDTGLSFAPAAWTGVVAEVDAWGRTWRDARARTCRATAVFHEQPADEGARRMRCLAGQLDTLDALLGQLRRPDRRAVERAPAVFADLDDPRRCERGPLPAIADPAVSPGQQALAVGAEQVTRQGLAAAALGRYPLALALDAIAVALADGASLPRVRHAARAQHGLVLGLMGDSRKAIGALTRAAAEADEAGDDEARTRALIWLADRHYFAEDYATGLSVIAQGMTVARRVGSPPLLVANLLSMRGLIEYELKQYDAAAASGAEAVRLLEARGVAPDRQLAIALARSVQALQMLRRHDEARAALERALAIRERVDGPDHPGVATLLVNLAAHLLNQQRPADAVPLLERAQRIRAAVFGPAHTSLAQTWQNLGVAYRRLGRLEDAEAAFGKALAQFRSSPELAYLIASALLGLGNLDMTRGHFAAAVPKLEEAVERFTARQAATESILDAQFRLARALWHSGVDRRRGLALARQVRGAYATIGDMPKVLAEVDGWIADPAHAPLEHFK